MKLTLKLLFISIIVLTTNQSHACKCSGNWSLKQSMDSSDYIALVKVVDVLSAHSPYYHKIKIVESVLYKGESQSEIYVDGGSIAVDSTIRSSCDLGIEKGEEWIIFASKNNGKYFTGFCGNSMPYRDKMGFREINTSHKINLINEINAYFSKPSISFYKKNGHLILYYPNGQKEAVFHFRNGLKNGACTFYYPDGSLLGTGFYKKGNKDGIWKSFDRMNSLENQTSFENGIQVDSSLRYSYSIPPVKHYLKDCFYYNKKGEVISFKSYSFSQKIDEDLKIKTTSDIPYISYEWYIDTLKNEKTTIYYHPNGRVSIKYMEDMKTGEYIGDIVDYNEAGFVIKVLRVLKGKKNEIIYIDNKVWPNYKKEN